MAYFAMFHWVWLVSALLLGFGIGWIAVVHRGRSVSQTMINRIAIVFVVFAGIALTRLIPGRAGYWLDLGLVMFILYLAGCAIGSWLRHRVIAAAAQ